MISSYMNWSGGKDSALCLYKALQSKVYSITHLLTSVNAVHNRISMHGVRRALLERQAAEVGISLQTIELPEQPGMKEYESITMKKVQDLKNAGCTHSIFGDIFLEDLRIYRERKLAELGIECVFPLWNKNTTLLAQEFIQLGFRSIVVCINEKYLDKSFCGRIIDESFFNDLPKDVDPCGENGEFHSFVFSAPNFKSDVDFTKGEIVYRKYPAPKDTSEDCGHCCSTEYGFYFCDLLPSY